MTKVPFWMVLLGAFFAVTAGMATASSQIWNIAEPHLQRFILRTVADNFAEQYGERLKETERNQVIILSDQASIKQSQRDILKRIEEDKAERQKAYDAILKAIQGN